MPAVIYAAKSTDDKHGSIPTQITDCREMLQRLAELRRAVAGQIASGEVAAVRATMTRIFESFTLRRLDDGDGLVELDLCLSDTFIEPKLRAEAIAGYEQVYAEDSARTLARPVLRREGMPLMASSPRCSGLKRSPLDAVLAPFEVRL